MKMQCIHPFIQPKADMECEALLGPVANTTFLPDSKKLLAHFIRTCETNTIRANRRPLVFKMLWSFEIKCETMAG